LFCGILFFEHYLLIIINSMEEGTIARLTDRGFGFIKREGEEKDLFFHSNELKGVEFNDLKEGDKVTFEVTEGEKGPQATSVNRA
jgi:CspA family cold shock protein